MSGGGETEQVREEDNQEQFQAQVLQRGGFSILQEGTKEGKLHMRVVHTLKMVLGFRNPAPDSL